MNFEASCPPFAFSMPRKLPSLLWNVAYSHTHGGGGRYCRKMFVGGLSPETTRGLINATPHICDHLPPTSQYMHSRANNGDAIARRGSLCSPPLGDISRLPRIDRLKGHFAQFGEVIDCVVMTDPATGRTRYCPSCPAALASSAAHPRQHTMDRFDLCAPGLARMHHR